MELKNWKLFLVVALLSVECFAQQTIAPFKTQQANTVFYVNMGNTTLTTIQKTVTAACAYSTATLVDILPGSNPSDTIGGLTSACTTTAIYDQRSTPAGNYTCTSGGCTLVPYATGSVTTFSATGSQGVTTVVTNPTTTPALAIGLGAITPTSVTVKSASEGWTMTATGITGIDATNTSDIFLNNAVTGGSIIVGRNSTEASSIITENQVGGEDASGAPTWSVQNADGASQFEAITNTSLTSGDFVVSGSGGIQINGPAVANVPLLNATNVWGSGGINTFGGSTYFQGGTSVYGEWDFVPINPASNVANAGNIGFYEGANYWNGTSSQSCIFVHQSSPGTGTNPIITFFGLFTNCPAGAVVSYPAFTALTLGIGTGHSYTRHTTITCTLAPTAVGANSFNTEALTCTGIQSGDFILGVLPPTFTNYLPAVYYSTTANTIIGIYTNPTAASVTPPTGSYTFDVEQ